MAAAPRSRPPFLGLLSWPERQAVARALRTETVGGLVLLAAAVSEERAHELAAALHAALHEDLGPLHRAVPPTS
ncbi:hypothetical protein [Streptomyces canus]|uniref:hypothetical protein n=1 Tax=Streptomyces canus TaxID=58343 RepID=UPI00224D424D|nr:hypothetical protein [Streptomyces canus]MCX4854388.1 hypothetical protein [Streptomyces canus]